MKNLSNREEKRRTFLKYYKSVENRLHNENLIWWNSLSMKARYHFVFKWMLHKKFMNKYLSNRTKFRYFLEKNQSEYTPSSENRRDAIIEHLIS